MNHHPSLTIEYYDTKWFIIVVGTLCSFKSIIHFFHEKLTFSNSFLSCTLAIIMYLQVSFSDSTMHKIITVKELWDNILRLGRSGLQTHQTWQTFNAFNLWTFREAIVRYNKCTCHYKKKNATQHWKFALSVWMTNKSTTRLQEKKKHLCTGEETNDCWELFSITTYQQLQFWVSST